MHKNSEGYNDPTAGIAMSHLMQEFRHNQRRKYAIRNRKKVYVASKFSGDEAKNTKAAISYCREVIDQGYLPVASHLLYPQILDDHDAEEREIGLQFGMALLAVCDELWVFGDISPGMEREIQEAERLKKRIRYVKE